MKIYFATFGCKVNTGEDQYYLSQLIEQGYSESLSLDDADIVVINTCAVTQVAAKKSENYIVKLRKNYPDMKIVVTGCLAEESTVSLKEKGADIVVSNGSKNDLVRHILEFSDGLIKAGEGSFSGGAVISHTKGKTRAFFKIQDGCDAFCTYCIIPKLRGAPKSMPIDEAVTQFKSLLNMGYKEIVLVGIHIGLYGKDLGYSITDLLERLVAVEGDFRIRLTSIEVNEIDDRLLNLIKNNTHKICRHLHIPLQSGCDKILTLMGRKYKRQDYIDTINKARDLIDDVTFGSDIIAGFPNECEADFIDSLNCLKEAGTDFYHAFPYSEREGTKAVDMDNKVPQAEKEERSKRLREQGLYATEKRYKSSIGKVYRVLSEKGNKGHSDNYILIHYDKDIAPNNFINVEVVEYRDNKLYGKVID